MTCGSRLTPRGNRTSSSAVGDALRAIEPLRTSARTMADAYRQFDIERGNTEMPQFARNLASLVELSGLIAGLAGLDAHSLDDVTPHVDCLLSARETGDWVAVADVLDDEIVAALDQWRGVLADAHRTLLDSGVPV
ncbi:MAG: hypothetical protein QM736_28795 [Vicinamibacterales bacterium]